jgi:hypothetical protein
MDEKQKTRLKGLLKLLGGGVVFALLFSYIHDKGLTDKSMGGSGPFRLIAIGLPGAFALVGLIETVTGLPFTQISKAWDDLAGWQRGLYGTLVVIAAIIIVFFVLVPVFGSFFL